MTKEELQAMEDSLINTVDLKYIFKQMNLAFLHRKKSIVCDMYNVHSSDYFKLLKYLREKGHKTETLLISESSIDISFYKNVTVRIMLNG